MPNFLTRLWEAVRNPFEESDGVSDRQRLFESIAIRNYTQAILNLIEAWTEMSVSELAMREAMYEGNTRALVRAFLNEHLEIATQLLEGHVKDSK